jgi:lipoyl(octanoyl) transferase
MPSTLYWGLVDYPTALSRQIELVDKRIQAKVDDTLIFVQHPPVFTISRRLRSKEHLLWPPSTLKEKGIALAETNRGGDITYHGPGQLVAYAIIDLRSRPDLHAHLRRLEQVVLAVLANLGLTASLCPGKTGVWLGNKKIAALGVAARHWVAYHGLAINVCNDLTPFEGIIPCGIPREEGGVTSVEEALQSHFTVERLEPMVHGEFWKIFEKGPPYG